MATNTEFTGGGSTVSFTATGVTISATSIGGSTNTLPRAVKTNLQDDVEKYIVGDTMDHDEVTVDGWAKMADVKTLRAAIDGATKTTETIRVTDPLLEGEDTASFEESDTAFITAVNIGPRVNNEVVTLQVMFTWGEGSTHTDGVPTP